MLTFLPIEEIKAMENWEDNRINEKKEILAYELTSLVHGHDEADKAKASAHALFGGAGDSENMPTTEISDADLTDGKIGIIDLVVKCGFSSSRGEAKRLIQQGGVSVNDTAVSDLGKTFTKEELQDGLKIKKGKKHFHKAVFNS